jgi:diguanylate cyclase (GGDEF)-like protein
MLLCEDMAINNLMTNMYISINESLGIYTRDQLYELFTTRNHGLAISRHRGAIIQSRVFFFCTVFAVLVPAWSLIDLLFLPNALWGGLISIRLISGAIFAILAWRAKRDVSLMHARVLLAGMLAVTPLFYLVSEHWLQGYPLSGSEQIIAGFYGLLPFVMVAGLTLFPLTLSEFISYTLPMFLLTLIVVIPRGEEEIPQVVATLWLLILILGVALFSSLSQLRYMLSQISRASYDVLTGVLSRRAGIEMLDLQFRLAQMNESELSLLYLDLDHFKSINDTYGHDQGDVILKTAAQMLCKTLRKGDSVIRWGGEEFIVVLPAAGPDMANDVVQRIMQVGVGQRPDGEPVTASIGISEIRCDEVDDWKSQVEMADHRMYMAKSGGRARSMGVNGEIIMWVPPVNSKTR